MTFQEEDNKLFNDILKRNYFNNFNKKNSIYGIEIILNQLCSSNCKYCYLEKYQKELFPINLYDKEQIIKNFDLIIQWYIENKFNCNIDIFSGEWLTTDLMEPIFEILYKNFKNLHNYQKPYRILIPDNMNFINNDKITQKIQNYINLFNQIGIKIIISASIDGKECDNDRTKYSDEFYIKCFNFCVQNNFLCHPMISSSNIKHWIKNYQWWISTAPKEITEGLMMLEVRDETWTTDNINDLLKFCDFLIDFKLKYIFNNDLIKFTNYIFKTKINQVHNQYSPELLPIFSTLNDYDHIQCTFSRNLMIRCSDLSLCLCHRLTYKELLLGHFVIKNNKIFNIEMNENKVPLLIVKTHIKPSTLPCCEQCIIQPICPGFCCGNSYENYKNILIPTEEVCNMYKIKYGFLIKKYEQLGIFDIIKENQILNPLETQYILDLKENLVKIL